MEDIQARRARFDTLGKNYPKDDSVKVEQESINGINCYWFTPENAAPGKIAIHLHGGAFAVGSIRSHESMVSYIAKKLQSNMLLVDYSLAPEKPFPAALNDVMAVYGKLITIYPDHEITFIGDSAGAGLTVSAIGQMLERDLPLPNAVIMISPWISLACHNASYITNKEKDVVLSPQYIRDSAADYIGDAGVEVASPESVELSGFPPVLIVVGTNEVLLDDSVNFYNYIRKIQPDSTLTVYENQYHVWPLANISSEASQKVLKEMDNFLKSIVILSDSEES